MNLFKRIGSFFLCQNGRMEGNISTAHNLYEMGLDLDKIAKALECKITQVKEWLSTH